METAINTDNKRISLQFEDKNLEQNGDKNAEVIDKLCYYSYLKNISPFKNNVFLRNFASTDISKLSKVYEPAFKRIDLLFTCHYNKRRNSNAFVTSIFFSTYFNM